MTTISPSNEQPDALKTAFRTSAILLAFVVMALSLVVLPSKAPALDASPVGSSDEFEKASA